MIALYRSLPRGIVKPRLFPSMNPQRKRHFPQGRLGVVHKLRKGFIMARVKTVAAIMTVGLILVASGCTKTFHSYRVMEDDCKFKGVPAMMHKTHIATVHWEKGQVTQHICVLPVMYAVDVCPAPVGTTEAKISLAEDGQLTGAEAKLDQKIPELIKSLGDAVAAIAPGKGRAASGGVVFTPSIDPAVNPDIFKTNGQIVSIELHEVK
jgi:hypothetical protein